jgi:NADH-quinone oxidoreductase subunit M
MATGPVRERMRGVADMRSREVWVAAPLIAVIVALGFYPAPVLDIINPAVERTMSEVGVSDPAPLLPAAAHEGTEP